MDIIEEILRTYHTVAIVGLSADESRPSNRVAKHMKVHGYNVIPVNPSETEIIGLKSYPNLAAIPEPVDIVDIFRRSVDVPPIVDQAIHIGAKVVWMQDGVENEEAAEKARKAGIKVVMDDCIMREHRKYIGELVGG